MFSQQFGKPFPEEPANAFHERIRRAQVERMMQQYQQSYHPQYQATRRSPGFFLTPPEPYLQSVGINPYYQTLTIPTVHISPNNNHMVINRGEYNLEELEQKGYRGGHFPRSRM